MNSVVLSVETFAAKDIADVYVNGDWNGSVCGHVARAARPGVSVTIRRGYSEEVYISGCRGNEYILCDISPDNTFSDGAMYVLISSNMSVMRKYEDVNAPNLFKIFDHNTSSALLLYRYLAARGYFEDKALPRSVKYYDDINMRNYALPGSRAVEAWTAANMIHKALPEIDKMTDAEFNRCIDRGGAIITYRDTLVRSACSDHITRGLTVGKHKLSLCIVVSTSLVDEIATHLLTAENTPDNRVVVICRYSVRKDQWAISMRSEHAGFDVGRYCETRGGGGNKYSGGFVYKGSLDKLFEAEQKIARERAVELDLDVDYA